MYQMILIPIVAAIVAQIIKLIVDATKKQFSWTDLNSYGGMPSSHSAAVVSLAAAVGYYDGWDRAAFAIAVVLALIIIRDAVGYRRQLGLHAQILNQHLEQLPAEKNFMFPHLRQRLGHTPLEILAGVAVGLLVTALYIILI
jgi:acid phosphatase family membrane protein YuiD